MVLDVLDEDELVEDEVDELDDDDVVEVLEVEVVMLVVVEVVVAVPAKQVHALESLVASGVLTVEQRDEANAGIEVVVPAV